jgi:predicted RecB family nuclease
VYVARASGAKIENAGIIHINKDYKREAELDVRGLLTVSAQTAQVKKYLNRINGLIARQKNILLGAVPDVEPGGHCYDPYECEFWERCTERKPEDWIFLLPRLSGARYKELQALGVESIRSIPKAFELNQLQTRIRQVLRSEKMYVGPGLAEALDEVGRTPSYLDFETISPAIPLWPGTYPFQRIPFQWSLHRTTKSGVITHAEFLARGSVDPRRAVAETLVKQLGSSVEKIVVYNKGFEGGVLRELASLFRDLAPKLLRIADRLWDLLPAVRNHVYHQGFGGSFSIKSVAPALAPEINYAALEGVAEGMAASDAFIRLATGELDDGETADEIRRSLLAYCKLDTLSMVRVYQALRKLWR